MKPRMRWASAGHNASAGHHPQLVRLALPGLANLWLILLKDTSLVSVIALDDLLRKTGLAVRVTKEPLPVLRRRLP